MGPGIESFIEAYNQALQDQNAAVFAGAGLSIPAGMVNWKNLLRGIARDIGLNVDKEDDLVTLAQFHVNRRRGRHQINQALVNGFASRARSTDNHRLLSSLPIRTFWTTNYDTLIEDALRRAGKNPDVKLSVENLATTLPHRDALVYKMHGDVSLPDQAVLTKDDYEAYNSKRQLFSTALQGDLVSKTFLFIGFSFSDPNLSYILSRIRLLLGENRRDHYCLLRRVQREDFTTAAQYRYAQAKQDLQVEDLSRYGIIGVLVDTYTDYTEVLRRVSNRHRMGRVFISGSAATYSPWQEPRAQELIHQIARDLLQEGFGIVSGLGLGVGPYVINGVLDQMERERSESLEDRIILRPFPLGIADPTERRKRWTAYRQNILSHAGVALFLFGNKVEGGVANPADGMEEEFRIAVQKGLYVVPVGCTGSKAAVLHKTVLNDFDHFFPAKGYKKLFEDLGRIGTPGQVAARILTLLKKLRDNA